MNKRITSLLCFGLSLTLVSCGKSSNNKEKEPVGPSITNIEDAYEAFGLNNGTVLADGFSVTEFYDGKATYVEYLGDYADYGSLGYIINGEQGIYEFTLDNGNFQYGDIVYPVANEELLNGAFYNLLDLQELGADVWTLQDDGSYTTEDIDTLNMFGYLNGNSYDYGDYMSDVKLTIKDNTIKFYSYMDFTEAYETDAYNCDCIVEISKVGSTYRKAINNAIKNPVEQLGLSNGYDTDLQAAMLEFAGVALPNFSWSKKSYWSTEYGTLSLSDFEVGNKVSEVVELLKATGWNDIENSGKYSGMDDDWNYIEAKEGDADWYEYTTLSYEATKDGVDYTYEIVVQYYTEQYLNDSEWTTSYTGLFPNGVLNITVGYDALYPYSYVEADLASLEFADNFVFPSLGFTSEPTSCVINNFDAYAGLAGCDKYLRSYEGVFEDYDTGIAQLALADASLLAAGLTVYTDASDGTVYSLDNLVDNGKAVYTKVFSDDTVLEVHLALDSNAFSLDLFY